MGKIASLAVAHSDGVCHAILPAQSLRIFAHKNTGDLQGRKSAKIQYKAVQLREKKQPARNNEEQREKQAETIKKQGTKDRAPSGRQKNPPVSSGGRRSHKSETRISAIADFARECKREKKALPLSPPRPPGSG
jgi:hypothetical protein